MRTRTTRLPANSSCQPSGSSAMIVTEGFDTVVLPEHGKLFANMKGNFLQLTYALPRTTILVDVDATLNPDLAIAFDPGLQINIEVPSTPCVLDCSSAPSQKNGTSLAPSR